MSASFPDLFPELRAAQMLDLDRKSLYRKLDEPRAGGFHQLLPCSTQLWSKATNQALPL